MEAKNPRAFGLSGEKETAELEKRVSGANLQSADLWGVKNLSDEQLSRIQTLYGAKLNPELMEMVKQKFPHLLEKPKDEEKEK